MRTVNIKEDVTGHIVLSASIYELTKIREALRASPHVPDNIPLYELLGEMLYERGRVDAVKEKAELSPMEKIKAFVARVNEEIKQDPWFGDRPSSLPFPRLSIDKGGRKYARIVTDDRSAWGFIEIATGDLYKAASWASPAKHARGNIATASYGKNYTWTGPNYMC